jgi:hypothetical protein
MDNTVKSKDIHAVLGAQRLGRAIPQTSLHCIILASAMPVESVTIIDDVELIDWLIHHIVAQLNYHRNHFGLSPVCMSSSMQQSLHELTHDFQQNATELEAWSLLYFYYVRVDLCLNWGIMAAATAQSQRNLRRRRKHGLNRLLYHIIRERVLTA